MANADSVDGERRGNPWRIAGWGTAAGLVLLPLVAMQFTQRSRLDRVRLRHVAIVMLGSVGLGLELAVRARQPRLHGGGRDRAAAVVPLVLVRRRGRASSATRTRIPTCCSSA